MNEERFNGAFIFEVELSGLFVGGFSEVYGLEVETEMQEYREGGVNGHIHRFPKGVRHQRIVLKRGLTSSPELWRWYYEAAEGFRPNVRRDGSIILYDNRINDRRLEEVCRWNFKGAYPVKWVGPHMNAMSSDMAIESIEIVHNGLKAVF